jgi:hypothetical protein
MSERLYSAALFAAAFGYFYIFYGKQQHVLSMPGDNLCQIAYWKILFHSNLIGSIGASYTKPGQLVVLGILNDLTLLLGENVFSVGICLVMAGFVWSLLKVASDIGGRAAAVIAFPAICGVFLLEYMYVSFSIFLVPFVYSGIRYYFYDPKHKPLGRLLLLLSMQFHIQAVALLGTVWCVLIAKREWKELVSYTGLGLLSASLWVAVILKIQGTLERLNSGARVGYVAAFSSFNFHFDPNDKIGYFIHEIKSGFLENYYYVMFLSVFALIGVAGSIRYGYKQYLYVFSAMLLLFANVVLLGGAFNYDRYCALFYAFGITIGIAVTILFVREIVSKHRLLNSLVALSALISLLMIFDFSLLTKYVDAKMQTQQFVVTASNIISDNEIPESTRLMTEDDLLYPLVVMQPERYSHLSALQCFNVASVAERRRILSSTDYIWIAMDGSHGFYYRDYLPFESWVSDPFRLMVDEVLYGQKNGYLYGYRFVPVRIDPEKLILKVEPEKNEL